MQEPNYTSYSGNRLPSTRPVIFPAAMTEDVIEVAPNPAIDIPALARKYLLLAIVLIILGAALGFVAVAFFPAKYRARATVEIQPIASSVLRLQAIEGEGGQVDLQTEAQVLLSNTFLRQVVQRIGLEPAPLPARTDIFSKMRKYLKIDLNEEVPVEVMREGLEAEQLPKPLALALTTVEAHPIERTRIIEISCESTSPELAANFLNALADEYIQQNLTSRLQTVQVTTQWLAQQLEEKKSKMLEADGKLEEFVRKSGNLFVSKEQDNTLADSQLRELQERLSFAQADLISKQARYEMVQKASQESLPEVIDDSNVHAYQAKLNDLRREEASLTTIFTPEHPKVKRLQVQIVEVQSNLKKEIDTAIKKITAEYELAKRNKDSLTTAYGSAAARVSAQGGKAAEYGALKRESESARQAYNSLLLQANQTSIAGSLPVNNIRVTDRSVPPREPSKPKPFMIIGIGSLAGLGLCGGIAFLREALDRRVTSPLHARQLLNLPQLGVIPSLEKADRKHQLAPILAGDGSVESSPSLPRSLLAESFRVTLASLMRESANVHKPQVILVTSPGPEEGKTTIASNLGIALAEIGRKVLVLDGDFRRPRAHKALGLPNSRGLVDLLEEDKPLGEYAKGTFGTRTSVPNLFLLPNGRKPEKISKLLYSPRLRQLLQTLRAEFDTVLVDAAPMLQLADARVMSELADGVVLVLRSGVTDKDSATLALEQLRSDGAVILGTVLNDWKPSKAEIKKSYYYGAAETYDRA